MPSFALTKDERSKLVNPFIGSASVSDSGLISNLCFLRDLTPGNYHWTSGNSLEESSWSD